MVSNVEDILKEEIKESGELKGKYPYIKVDASKLRDIILKLLKAFDEEVHVITITAVDYPDKGVLELNYELWIYPIKKPLIVKVEVPRDKPEVPSIVDFRAEIICEKGVYYVDQLGQTVSVADMGRMTYPRFLGAYKVNNRFYGFVRESLHHLVDCLLNEEKPMISPEDGLANTKVLIAILESVKNIGRRISI